MYWETALGGALEISVALAGFSGIVVAVASQRKNGTSLVTRQRLQILLTASAAAAFFSFLPFIMFEMAIADRAGWRIGSGLQATWMAAIVTIRVRQFTFDGFLKTIPSKLISPIMLVIGLSQIANAMLWGFSWLYLVGIVFMLGIAFANFSAMLFSTWTDMESDDDAV